MTIAVDSFALARTALSRSTLRLTTTHHRHATPALTMTRFFSQRNKMMAGTGAAANPSTREWMCYIPDHPNAFDKRMEVRPKHLQDIMPNIESRRFVFGGATLSKQPEQGESPVLNGSFMLIQAETKEEALEWLKRDVYGTSRVWNMDAVQVWPFKSAFRTPTS